ncbi:hypothetical protein PR202_gb10167 [Eleusine coracana subsp. coracana]|uniref:Pentatricopeptide repeat-containing protein n=1 Tax=Eleusine coracana subsp. coracana TaxID=191504 RepID=A0AAV5EJ93_ELECO|nr:hypothetical protein PR202_gb10167 [Eleusine coracana subsp. coracana]
MMHAHLLKTACLQMLPVANSLLAVYDPASAAKLFDQMPLRDHVSWTTIIGACVPAQAVALFRRMLLLDPGIRVDGVVLVVLVRASATLRDARLGSSLHATSHHAPRPAPRRRLLHADRCSEAIHLLQSTSTGQQQQLVTSIHVLADATTIAVLLQLCKKLARPYCCRSLHAFALRRLLLTSSTPLLNALLDAYAKCGLLDYVLSLFHQTLLADRNVVTWSTVIAACVGSDRPYQAMTFYVAMREAGQLIRPNSITMLSLLEACTSRADISSSRCAHGMVLRSGLASDLSVGNAIVDMYGKCGDLTASRRVFDSMPLKDILTWNSMIGAFGMNGCAPDALALVQEMERGGALKPNRVTLLAVLSACAHGGLLQDGVACLQRLAREYSVQPEEAHLTCIADMLARAGDVEGAAKIAGASGPAAWSAVLSGCRTTTNEIGQEAARRVLELEPGNSAGYLLAAMGAVNSGGMHRMMKERGVKVSGAYSMVHVAGEEHKFASWDGRHLHRLQVYAMLHLLHCQMMQKPPPPNTELCN